MASKESYKEHILKQIATNTGANIHDLRNDSHQEMRTDRVEKAVHFDISQDDDVTMTASSGVQAEAQTDSTGVQAKAQTISPGQPSKTKMDEFGGTQATQIRMKDKPSQATEDRSEEIEQLRQASELEKQVLIEQHEQHIGRVRQQVTEQVMAQAEAEHSRTKEGYKHEFLKKSQINEAEAQIIINQAQHQTQQEAKHYVGTVINYAEQAYIDQLSKERAKTEKEAKEAKEAKREHMKQLREERAQAELEILRAEVAEKRAKKAETSARGRTQQSAGRSSSGPEPKRGGTRPGSSTTTSQTGPPRAASLLSRVSLTGPSGTQPWMKSIALLLTRSASWRIL